MPFPRVPRKAFNETGLKDPKEGGFCERMEFFGYPKGGSMSFLYKDPDWVVALRGEGHPLRAHRSNKATVGNLLKFDGLHSVGRNPSYMVHPCKGGIVAKSPITDPISSLKPVGVCCRVPRNASYDDFLISSIDNVIWRVRRLFHSMSSGSQRSFILVQLDLEITHLSLRSLTPRGWLVVLIMRGY